MRRIIIFTILLILFLSESLYSQNINKPNIIGPAGLQVNSYTGRLYYKRTDLFIPGRGLSIDITFFYNSGTTLLDFGYGPGWTMTYSMSCKPNDNGDKMIVRHPDGRKDVYTKNGNVYTAAVGIFDSLVEYQTGKFSLRTKNGITYFFNDLTHHKLTSISDPNNNTITIAYDGTLPTSITDASGRSVQLTYTNGHLTKITDPNTSPAREIIFINDRLGKPLTVTDPLMNSLHYEYDVGRNIIKLIDQLSNQFTISYASFIFVTSIASPLNTLNTNYDRTQKKTTVTEMVNGVVKSTANKYNAAGNLIERIDNCCSEKFEYDANRNMKQKTDANNKNWLYQHDAKGNITKETDPLLKTMIYKYEPAFGHVEKITDKRGNISDYLYDNRGNLTRVNKPLGITESYDYDAFGNMTSFTDGRGFITRYQYNNLSYRTQVTFPNGTKNFYSYDGVGNMTSFTDANGNNTSYKYDKLNRLMSTTDALGHTTTYEYDARSDLKTEKDALGHIISYQYDALRRTTGISTPAGTTIYTYNENGNLLSLRDPKGNLTRYNYNSRDLLISEINAVGHSRTFDYDNNGNKITESDYKGGITSYMYDDRNLVKQITNPLSKTMLYFYDENGNRTKVSDANGHETVYIFDALNRMVQIQRPIGTTTYTYDKNDNMISISDPNGHITTYNFDEINRQSTETDAVGNKTFYNFDPVGNMISIKNRNGYVTTYSYDALNSKITETNPLGETFLTKYNPVGTVSSQRLPNGNTISYAYDAASRLISISDLMGTVAFYSYDANSNLVTETDGNGNTTSINYDALDRIKTITDPMGRANHFTYNNNSSVVNIQDRNGQLTNYAYDAIERNISTRFPEGNIMRTSYDAVGNVTSKVDDNGNTTSYSYDGNSRLKKETFDDGSFTEYNYDSRGNLISRKDNNNKHTIYSYDELDRLTTRDYLEGSNDDNFNYDNEDRMLSANNNNATIAFTYDNADRLLSETMNGNTTAYIYNTLGRKRTIIYPGGRNVQENYDLRGRLSQVNGIVNYTYDAGNRVRTRTFSNGVVATYAYNNNDWITNLKHKKNIITVADFKYSFDNEGNGLFAEKIHRNTNSEQYVYDANSRLINYKEGTLIAGSIPTPLTQSLFNYDGVGNRKTMILDSDTTIYLRNNLNEYTSIINRGVTILPVYDNNGNTTNDGLHSYDYDFENRLISVDGSLSAIYKYDALGRRIQKDTTGGIINYHYDGNRIIEERDGTNQVAATYIFGTTLDDIINMKRSGNDYFYHQNSLGSISAITNNPGSVVERYEYNAYGKPSIYDSSYIPLTSTIIGNSYMFTGREFDAESKNYHYRARFYNSDWGRFAQWDPIENDYANNLYSYVANNPTNFIDPSGMITSSCTKSLWEKWKDLTFSEKIKFLLQFSPPGLDLVEAWDFWESVYNGNPRWDIIYNKIPALGPTINGMLASNRGEYLKATGWAALAIFDVITLGKAGGAFSKGGTSKVSSSFVSWSERNSVNIERSVWSQKDVAKTFSENGLFNKAPVESIAKGLRSGAIQVHEVPIDVIVRNGQTFILNTRSSIALVKANVPRSSWDVRNRTGDIEYEIRLWQQLKNNELKGGTNLVFDKSTQSSVFH